MQLASGRKFLGVEHLPEIMYRSAQRDRLLIQVRQWPNASVELICGVMYKLQVPHKDSRRPQAFAESLRLNRNLANLQGTASFAIEENIRR